MGGLYLDPTTTPSAYDTVVFNRTLKTPGKCKVIGWHRPVEYDHKKGKAVKGAESTLKGLPPAKGSIEFETWTPDQRAAWTPILDALHFDPTKLGTGTSSTPAAAASANPGSQFSGGTVDTSATGSGTPAGAIPAPAAASSTSSSSSSSNQPVALSSAFAIEIFYPTLADIDVHFVLPPEKLGAWEPVGDDFSHMKRTIEFIEYTGTPPNTSIAATPTGPSDGTSGNDLSGGSPGTSPPAGSSEGAAPPNAAASSKGAAGDAQGAWGAP